MLLDMHCHSKYSLDAASSPRHIAEIAKEKGLIVALTDHDNCAGWKNYSSACKELGISFILGQEQKVFWEDSFAGELLFYFLNDEIKSKGVFEAIDEARAQDAMVSVAHPFDKFRKIPKGNFSGLERIIEKIDAVEVFNARSIFNSANSYALALAEEESLGRTAGSDAHFPDEIGNTFIEVDASSLEDARNLIRKGKVIVHGKKAVFSVHFRTQLVKRGLLKKETD